MNRFFNKYINITKRILVVAATMSLCVPFPVNAETKPLKGTWLSFLDYQELLKTQSKRRFDQRFDEICKTIDTNGCNSIFVHVRSHNDAIYPSTVYPWSEQMLDGADPGYDPLAEMIDIAHQNGLGIHAWINPYGYRQGKISENPELATLENILAGVEEILNSYDVDGIHFDDYFPPIGKDAINDMIRKVHEICQEHGKTFGISPQGNIENNIRNGADVRTWLSSDEYVDYIAPQIYWTDLYGEECAAKSKQTLTEWSEINQAGIPMYVGMALYRAGNEIEGDPGWQMTNDNLLWQWIKAKKLGYQGYIIYDTRSQMNPNKTQKEELERLAKYYAN